MYDTDVYGCDWQYGVCIHLDVIVCSLCLCKWLFKLKLIYDRQSVGQSALVSGAHLGPVTNFSFSLKFPVDSCGFIL
jgi:hypothetical protein